MCQAVHRMVHLAAKAAADSVEGAHQLAGTAAVVGVLQGSEHPQHLRSDLGLDPSLLRLQQ